MDEVRQVGLETFINHLNPTDIFDNQVIIMEIRGSDFKHTAKPSIFPFRLEAFSAVLVCKGEINITIDYQPYTLKPNMILQRGTIHLISDIRPSHDFMGYHLILNNDIMKSLFDEFLTIPKEFIAKTRNNPVQKLDHQEFQMLLDLLDRLRKNLHRKDHFFHKQLIINNVRHFILELFNEGIQKMDNSSVIEINYVEDLVLRFAKLLATRSKEWYEVSDYSTELCVTPVYLSRTIKAVSQKSAIEWIHGARIAEAKILLRNPDYSVQDVSDLLHFSDQSAFGKFFKKQAGMSPMEYKKSNL